MIYSRLSLMRPYKVIRYKPHNPTRIYTILDRILIFPSRNATRSKRNTPIRSQFKAPIITSVKLILSHHFIYVSSLKIVSDKSVTDFNKIYTNGKKQIL